MLAHVRSWYQLARSASGIDPWSMARCMHAGACIHGVCDCCVCGCVRACVRALPHLNLIIHKVPLKVGAVLKRQLAFPCNVWLGPHVLLAQYGG